MRAAQVRTCKVVAQKRDSSSGSGLPVVFDSFGIPVKETLELVVVVWLVEIMPFLRGVKTKPSHSVSQDMRSCDFQELTIFLS